MKKDRDNSFYLKEIDRLRKERNAVILAHNYQPEEIQLIADILGDSLDLSEKAAEVKEDVIVFAGVSFMAESAKVLAPTKTVLHPVPDSRCPMADMIDGQKVRELREQNPDAAVIAYINTNVETKMEVDAVCTSANAVSVARNFPANKIIFLPDINLGRFVKNQVLEKEFILYKGFCRVHEYIKARDLRRIKKEHPEAIVLTHPEANEEVCDLSDHLLGTGGMINFVADCPLKQFIIGTEEGLILRLRRDFPDKEFFPAQPRIICSNMKMFTLRHIYLSLKNMHKEVILSEEVIEKSLRSLENMFKYGNS
ncbi:quinolinate synthase NadA [bacterium]|nr:quinolinate synthase NadA [bacterium]